MIKKGIIKKTKSQGGSERNS